jgi:PncC family amidohydrolase
MRSLEKDLIQRIFQYCTNKHIVLRTAESCTGGGLASLLTTLPGSSNFFDRGVVTYSNISKVDLLNIPEEVLEKYGAVSFEVATLMAENLIGHAQNILSIATTGILGPTSDPTHQPVGLVYIALHCNNKTEVKKFNFSGDRDSIKAQVLSEALTSCVRFMQEL